MNKTMKTWFSMFALLLLAGFNSAFAQTLSIDNLTLKAGESAELTIKLASGAENTVYGFQTDIVIPDGLTMEVAPQAVAAVMADGADAAFSVNEQKDGSFRIAAFSLAGTAFKAETPVATFTVKAADDFSNVDGKYVGVVLKNTKFTVDINGTEKAAVDFLNEVDADLFTYPTRPITIGFANSKVVPAGIVTYAADREGLQVSGMQPVKGWYAASNGDARAAGVFEAGSATSFLGSTGFYAPATNIDGVPCNMLGILAVWTATSQYKQNVFLKAGEYYLNVNVFNAGGTKALAKNLIGFITADGKEFLAETTEYPVGAWKTESIRIVLQEDTYGTFSLGYEATDDNKSDMPHLFFDGVKLSNEIFPNNFRAYNFKTKRGSLGVRSTSVVVTNGDEATYNIYAAEATDFAVITYNDKTYLYSVPDKKFVKYLNGNLLAITNYAPEAFDISEWAEGGYHFVFGGNTLNVNGNSDQRTGYVINGWAYADAGNQVQVESVGDFDPTEALAILAAPEAAPAVTETPVANLAGLSNAKAYVIYNGARSWYWGITDKTIVPNPVLLPNETKEQFAVLSAGGNYYLWSIGAKKFLGVDKNDGDNNRNFIFTDEPQAVEIIETGNTDYPFYFRYGEGWVVNFNGNGVTNHHVINGWTSQDDGNRYAIREIGDYDASEAIAKLPASVGSGEYIIQNVGTGQFLFGGNNWGTRASLTDNSQYMIMHQLEDGKFNIESLQNNGGESYWVGWGNASTKDDIYVDCTIDRAITFALEPVGEGIYNIVIDENGACLAAPADGTIIEWVEDGTDDAAKWRIYPTADALAKATQDEPVDATYLIKDNDFDRNNRWNSDAEKDFGKAWTMVAGNQYMSGGNNENRCAESWHSTFDMSQVIKNAPKGVYKLAAQGFYRDDSNGALTKLPVLFANDVTSDFPEIKDEEIAGRGNIRDQGVAQMGDCSVWFANGDYPIAPVFFELTAAGDITLGVKYDQAELLWAIWDKFTLTYYGPDADINSVRIDGRDKTLDELYKKAVDLADDGYPEEITIALGHAIETADDAKAIVPPTAEAYDKAIAELEAAIQAADEYIFPATVTEVNVNLECGGYYEGVRQTVDIAAIVAELGAASLSDLTIAAVQPDGTYDSNYKLGETDGWRNAEGAWQFWGDAAYFYVKADFTLDENQLYEMGCYPGKGDAPVTFTATYSFKYGKHEVLLKVNLIYAEKVLTDQEQYELALTKLTDGKTYQVYTVVGETKYYLTLDGTLTEDVDEAGTFKFEKTAGEQWEYGFWLKSDNAFSNPANGDSFNAGALNMYPSGRRNTWEAQVFFNDGKDNYAVRSTNAAYATSSWGLLGSAYWAVYEGEDGPTAGYSYDKTNVWRIEEFVDERMAAFDMIQTWPALLQEKLGLVTDADYYSSNAPEPNEGSLAALLDGDYTTFFHSMWSGAGPDEDHYLEAEFDKGIEEFSFYFKKRSQNNNNRPTTIIIEASKNGSIYKEIATIEEGLPTDASVIAYQSEIFKMDAAYKFIRFTIPETNNGATHSESTHPFFTFSEFYIFDANDVAVEAAEYYGIASYKDLTTSDVEAIKALDEKIKNLGTGINDVNAGNIFENGAAYDLTGRKVVKAQKGGIYIVNGKKVMVK